MGAADPDNPYFGTAARLRYTAADVGPRASHVDSDFYRVLAGIKGTVADWDYDSAFLFSQDKLTNTRTGYLQRDVAFALLNPTAVNVAAATANSPAYAALPPGSYWRIAENANLNSAALYAALSPAISSEGNTKITQVDIKASRELMALQGGALGLAVGTRARDNLGMWRTTAPDDLRAVRVTVLAAFGLICFANCCQGAVFKCSQPNGSVAYQSVPCANGNRAALSIVDAPRVELDFPAAPPRTGGALPQIVGPEGLQQRAREALAILKARDPAAYAVVLGYIGRVEPGVRSAMRANDDPPTMLLASSAVSLSATYVASVFAHESFHSKLYYDYLAAHPGRPVPGHAWGGTESEIKCDRYALGVMRRIGAPKSEIDWRTAHSDGSHVNDLDYERDWTPPKRP